MRLKINKKIVTCFRKNAGSHGCDTHLATSAAIRFCRMDAEVPTAGNSLQLFRPQ